MSVDAGTTESRLEEICPPHKVAVSDAMQTFPVSAVAGPCCTIRVSACHAEGWLAAEADRFGEAGSLLQLLARQADKPCKPHLGDRHDAHTAVAESQVQVQVPHPPPPPPFPACSCTLEGAEQVFCGAADSPARQSSAAAHGPPLVHSPAADQGVGQAAGPN